MLLGGRGRISHILLPWSIVSPNLEEPSFSCLIAVCLNDFPARKGGKRLLSVPVTCYLSSANFLCSGLLLVLCKCGINLVAEISSLRSKSVRFISHWLKLSMSTKIITLNWATVALPVVVDRAQKVPGSGMPLPLFCLVKLVTHQLATSQKSSWLLIKI